MTLLDQRNAEEGAAAKAYNELLDSIRYAVDTDFGEDEKRMAALKDEQSRAQPKKAAEAQIQEKGGK